MSAFVCLGVKGKIDAALPQLAMFELMDVSADPIGIATLGGRGRGSAILVTLGGHSASIIDPARKKYDMRPQFFSSLREIIRVYPSIYFLYHWARGNIHQERIVWGDRVVMKLEEFILQYADR